MGDVENKLLWGFHRTDHFFVSDLKVTMAVGVHK